MIDEKAALLFKIQDPDLQRFFQMSRYSTTKDVELKKLALAALRDRGNWDFRTPVHNKDVEELPWQELDMNKEEKERLRNFLEVDPSFDEKTIIELMEWIGWRMAFLPEQVDDALILGPGSGIEVAYLWARRPGCRVEGVDLYDRITKIVKDQPNFTYEDGMISDYLKSRRNRYDLIFCNQVLEHMNTIDDVLSEAYDALRPGGMLVAGLPLEGDLANPLRKEMFSIAAECENIHSAEIPRLNLGHPWKTNASDIYSTLMHQGFEGIRIFTRDDHASARADYTIAQACEEAQRNQRAFCLVNSFPLNSLRLFSQTKRLAGHFVYTMVIISAAPPGVCAIFFIRRCSTLLWSPKSQAN